MTPATLPDKWRGAFPECVLQQRSNYQVRTPDGGEATLWRYVWRHISSGQRLIYSGQFLGLAMIPGKICTLRATVKRQETKWSMTRLARVRIIPDTETPMNF